MAPPLTLTRSGSRPSVADDGQGLRGKSLVEFDEIDLVQREAGPLQRLGNGGDGTDAHLFRQAAGGGVGNQAGQRLEFPVRGRGRLP